MKAANTILVPIDFNEQSLIALGQACHIARKMRLDITLLYVMEESGIFAQIFTEDQSEKMKEKVLERLDKLADETFKKERITVKTMFAHGRIYSKIIETSELINAKFIILGTRSEVEEGKKASGANSSRVIRYAKCPVISINGKNHYNGCRSILLPLDLTKQTRQKVTKAIEIAKYFGSTIKVMSALMTGQDYVIKKLKGQIYQVKDIIEEKNIKCTAEIVTTTKKEKTLAQAILNYAKKQKDIDLIILMTQQEVNWVEFFVGSTTSEVIRTTDIPVMTITPSHFDGTREILAY
ncbi:MAG: universal stress protein [Bacteroidales bacterium]|jgi:nucleotide-binding universal stress UspA family protein